MRQLSTKAVTERALLLALALVLDKFILLQLPQGGSISLGMLPIFIFALRHGLSAGLFLGGLAGSLQLILGGYFLSPLQFLLDYPLAYALVGLAGLVSSKNHTQQKAGRLLVGLTLGSLGRLLAHTLAGIAFYSDYAPKGTPVWLYSLTYNASFLLPSTLACYLIILLILKRYPDLLTRAAKQR